MVTHPGQVTTARQRASIRRLRGRIVSQRRRRRGPGGQGRCGERVNVPIPKTADIRGAAGIENHAVVRAGHRADPGGGCRVRIDLIHRGNIAIRLDAVKLAIGSPGNVKEGVVAAV